MMEQLPERLTACPSFRGIPDDEEDEEREGVGITALAGSRQEILTVQRPSGEDEAEEPAVEEEGEDGGHCSDDFEFAFVSSVSSDAVEAATADEIFSNGQIRPVYPLFNRELLFVAADRDFNLHADRGGDTAEKAVRVSLRKLMIEDRDPPSTSESESDELDGIPKDSYCVWTPGSVTASPDLRKKSRSTGATSKRWRLRDIVIGRSQSDGRQKFLFLVPPPPNTTAAEAAEKKRRPSTDKIPIPNPNPKKATAAAAAADEEKGTGKAKGKAGVRKVSELDMVTVHRLYYAKGGAAAAAAGDRRRSFLPYRKDLVGFFGNGAGLTFHPSSS